MSYQPECPNGASDTDSLFKIISEPRLSTFTNSTSAGLSPIDALTLYGWNATVSAALMLPAHFAEVSTRNAVSEALTTIYGDDWPRHQAFVASLPSPHTGFNAHREILSVRNRYPGRTGKVIADLKLIFWEVMFTSRFQERIWNPQIKTVFPQAQGTAASIRSRIHTDLKQVRDLRNRLAHYEPVINRDLEKDLQRMFDLVDLRSTVAGAWIRQLSDVSTLLAARP